MLTGCCLLAAPSCYAGSQIGWISFYSSGRLTASGERFKRHGMTCAHRRLPFGTLVKVEYRGKVVTCRVNDRGPFKRGRILDLSLGAASALGMIGAGVGRAKIAW
jgi:rare lipoprotein A